MQDKQFDAIMEQLMNVTEQMTTLGKRLDGIENRLDKNGNKT